jgi:DNA repair exonuclease SbcCD ATPase subunit
MAQAEVDAQQRAVRSLTNQPRVPEIVDHPSNGPSQQFNTMAEKLKNAMAEVTQPSKQSAAVAQTNTPAPSASPKPDAASPAAQKPTAAPPQADKPASKDEDDVMPSTSKGWEQMRSSIKKWKTEAIELRTKDAELGKALSEKEKLLTEYKPKIDKYSELEKQLSEKESSLAKLTDKLKLVALEQSDEFGGFFQKQFDATLERVKDGAGENAELVASLLASPQSKWRKEKLQEVISQLPDIDRATVAMAVADYDRISNDKANQLKDWRTNYERLQAQREAKAKQTDEMRALQENTLVKELVSEIAQRGPELQPIDGDDVHNARVQERLAVTEKFFRGQLERNQILDLIHNSFRFDPDKISKLEAELAQAKEAVATYQNANPSAAGATARAQPKAPTGGATNQERPFLRKFMEVLGQEQ